MNKAELIDVLTKKLDTDRRQATDAVENVVDTIVRAVHKGDSVTITGFGVFEQRRRAARVARNPRTGETVKVKPTSVPAFRPGAQFKAVVSGAQRLPAEGPAVKRGADRGRHRPQGSEEERGARRPPRRRRRPRRPRPSGRRPRRPPPRRRAAKKAATKRDGGQEDRARRLRPRSPPRRRRRPRRPRPSGRRPRRPPLRRLRPARRRPSAAESSFDTGCAVGHFDPRRVRVSWVD